MPVFRFVSLEQLAGKFQFLLWRKGGFIGGKGLRVFVAGKIPLRSGIFAGNAAELAGNQLFAEEEGCILPFRQAVIADAEL